MSIAKRPDRRPGSSNRAEHDATICAVLLTGSGDSSGVRAETPTSNANVGQPIPGIELRIIGNDRARLYRQARWANCMYVGRA